MNQISFVENIFITIVEKGTGEQTNYSYNLVSAYCQEGWKISITKEEYEILMEYYKEEENFREETISLKARQGIQDYRYHAAWLVRPAIPIYGFENMAANVGNKKGTLIINFGKTTIKEELIKTIAQATVNHAYLQQSPFLNDHEYQQTYTEHTTQTGQRFLRRITDGNNN